MATDRPGISDDDIAVHLHWPSAPESHHTAAEVAEDDSDDDEPVAAVTEIRHKAPPPELSATWIEANDRLVNRVLERLHALREDVGADLTLLRSELASLRLAVDDVGDRVQRPELEQVSADIAGLRADVSGLLGGGAQAPTMDSAALGALREEVAALREEMVSLRRRISLRVGGAPVELDERQIEHLAAQISQRLVEPGLDRRAIVAASRWGRRRLRRWAGYAALGVLVLGCLLGVAMFRLARAGHDLREAQDRVSAASTAIEDGRLADARAALADAQGLVLSANNVLYQSVELRLLGWLPVAHTNLESLRDSVGLAATVIDGGRRVLTAAIPLESPAGTLEVSLSDGSVPLEAVSRAETEVSALSVQLPVRDRDADPRFLVSQARDLHTEVYGEAIRRRAQLDVLGHGLRLLEQIAGGDGPRRYLIAVSNNAEMRGSGGMVLNYGVLEGHDGVIDLTQFGRIDELLLRAPVSDTVVPADYLARWAGFDPLLRWRQANLAGDFTVVAPVLEAMYTSATGQSVDGVIQIDPVGLAAILDGVSPVVVPELGEVNGDNVAALTLNEAYTRFPGIEARSDVLGDVAEAAFRRLVDGDIPSLRMLATRLAEAAAGRHIVMHGTTGRVEDELVSFGADGAYPATGDALALTMQNLAGNKLDYYLDSELKVTGELSDRSVGTLRAQVTLHNTAPAGVTQPRYVFGPGPTATPLAPGVLRSLVTLYLPFGSTLTSSSGDALVEAAVDGTEAGRPFASFTVDVPAGATRTVVLELEAPPRSAVPLVVVPSPTLRPTAVVLDVASPGGTLAGAVELDRTWAFLPGGEPAPVPAPAFR